MQLKSIQATAVALAAVLVGSATAGLAVPVGSAFTYQGRLVDAGSPANGPYDLRFTLFDAATGGAPLGTPITVEDVAVAQGLFTVSLDFGAAAFAADARWLEIAARPGTSTGSFATVGGRQALTPSPFAIRSETAPWTGVSGKPPGFADNVDNDSGGTVTAVATGSGLTGGPITGSGTVSVASGGIVSGMIANGAVGLAQINTGQVQARIGGTCPAGSYLRGINADGSVSCEALLQPHVIRTVDDPGSVVVGTYTSIAISPQGGAALIAHHDSTNGDLRLVGCGNATCSFTGVVTLDNAANVVGLYPSLKVPADTLPVISYHDDTANTLKVLKCSDPFCGGPTTITTVDDPPVGGVGEYSSLAIGADGLPVIAYYDQGLLSLKVAKCQTAACNGAVTITQVDNPANTVGQYASIAIGTDGLPVISYFDATAGTLKVARCGNAACNAGNTLTTVDDPANVVGDHTSIAVPADGRPVIAYRDVTGGDLKIMKCGNAACTSGNVTNVVDNAFFVGQFTSIAIGADGLPIVSYHHDIGRLKVVKCGDAGCAPATNTVSIVDSPLNTSVGRYTSIAIPADGLPLISYHDLSNGALKVAKCGNVTCQ